MRPEPRTRDLTDIHGTAEASLVERSRVEVSVRSGWHEPANVVRLVKSGTPSGRGGGREMTRRKSPSNLRLCCRRLMSGTSEDAPREHVHNEHKSERALNPRSKGGSLGGKGAPSRTRLCTYRSLGHQPWVSAPCCSPRPERRVNRQHPTAARVPCMITVHRRADTRVVRACGCPRSEPPRPLVPAYPSRRRGVGGGSGAGAAPRGKLGHSIRAWDLGPPQ